MEMYSNYSYGVDTVTPNALYQSPQMTTPPNSATSPLSMSPTYITTTTTLAPSAHPMSQVPRRRVSPDQYLDMQDAASKVYRNPASRKDLFLQSKRHLRQPSDEEEDELNEDPPAPNATEQERMDWKRKQNTLAARRSRKRKLLYQQQLESAVERLTMEKEVWKTRALTLKQLLQGHGIPCPDFDD